MIPRPSRRRQFVGLFVGLTEANWRAIWKYDENRLLIIVGLIWAVFAGFSIYGIVTFARLWL